MQERRNASATSPKKPLHRVRWVRCTWNIGRFPFHWDQTLPRWPFVSVALYHLEEQARTLYAGSAYY